MAATTTTGRRVVLGLGSNLGSREALLRAARDLVAYELGASGAGEAGGVRVSRVYETAPVGPSQPDYLNAAVAFESERSPDELLAMALGVEKRLGRERRERWGARTIDVDVLWVEGVAASTGAVTVPHPELRGRAFALAPLVDVAEDARDPATGEAYEAVLAAMAPASPREARALGDGFDTVMLDHTADEGFVVRARDRADALAGVAEALAALVVNPASVAPAQVVPVEVAVEPDMGDDERVFTWLAEVLYHVDARRFAVRRAVVFDDGAERVAGALIGEDLDEARHDVKGAVKAVTYHALEAGAADDGGYRAQVIIDV